MKQELMAFLHEEDGVTAIEYGLIAGLIAAGIIVSVSSIGTEIAAMFKKVADALTTATTNP